MAPICCPLKTPYKTIIYYTEPRAQPMFQTKPITAPDVRTFSFVHVNLSTNP